MQGSDKNLIFLPAHLHYIDRQDIKTPHCSHGKRPGRKLCLFPEELTFDCLGIAHISVRGETYNVTFTDGLVYLKEITHILGHGNHADIGLREHAVAILHD